MTKKLAESYKKAYGFWEVTTEGDCEGKSSLSVGSVSMRVTLMRLLWHWQTGAIIPCVFVPLTRVLSI